MVALPASVTRLPARALSLASGWPWYGWAAAAAAGLATLLVGALAFGATPPEGEGGGDGERPEGAPPLLKLGATGPWVSYLQARLGIASSGTFDLATNDAVKAYQAAHGLDADGIVGAKTWGALGVEGSAAPPKPGGGGGGTSPPITPAPPSPPTTGNPFGLSAMVAEREGQILSHIAAGRHEHQWHPLDYVTPDGHAIHVEVSRRALALSEGSNRLMVSMTFNGAQKVADMIGGAMLTTRLADEIWKAAGSKPTPTNQSWNTDSPVTGGKTDRMYQQSDQVNTKVLASGAGAGLVGNEGKDWVLARRFWAPPAGINPSTKPAGVSGSPHNSANFGLYMTSSGWFKSPGGADVIQSIGLAHDRGNAGGFVDYSQILRFVRQGSLTIDGVPWDYAAALADPSVSKYLQDEGGTMPGARHPDL